MKVITFLNEKGGVGKTTLSSTVIHGLARRGYRVLGVDADGQGNLTKYFQLAKDPCFYNLCVRGAAWGEDTLRTVPQDATGEIAGQVYLVPSNFETAYIATALGQQALVQQLYARFHEIQNTFDYVIIDSQPNPTPLHDALSVVTDYLILPTECEAFSALEGLPSSVQHTQQNRQDALRAGLDVSKILAIVPNQYRSKLVVHQTFYNNLRESYGDLVWSPIQDRVAIKEAQLHSMSIFEYAPKSQASRQLWQFTQRIEQATQVTENEQ